MRYILVFLIVVFLSLVGQAGGQVSPTDCKVFAVVRKQNEIGVEGFTLRNSESKAFPIKKSDGIVTIVLPYSVGLSGDLVRLGEERTIVGSCSSGTLSIKIKRPDGSSRDLPDLDTTAAARFDIRVSITGQLVKKAYSIISGTRIEPADGPVMDMFGGQIPLGPDDFSIAVETKAASSEMPGLSGEAQLVFDDYLFTTGKFKDGVERTFVIDTAASRSVLDKRYLPPDTLIESAKSTEYSEKGARTVDFAASGAGGKVANVQVAGIPQLTLGSISITGRSFLVLDQLPELGGRKVAGIVGLDVLRNARYLSFGYSDKPKGAVLRFGQTSTIGSATAEMPFTIAFETIYLKASIGGKPVELILDTGAPQTALPAGTTGILDLKLRKKPVTGIDGRPIEASEGRLKELGLGGNTYRDVPVMVADLPIFRTRGGANTGLIGNSFLKRFSLIEIDLAGSMIRFRR